MKNKLTLLCIAVLIVLTVQACGGDRLSGRIAFLSQQNGNWHLFTMNADGSNVVRIRTGLSEDGCAVWSPDGHQIMFVSSNGKGFEHKERNIYIVDTDSSNLVWVTQGESGITNASWSPDGSRIVFSAGPNVYPINIYVGEANGSNVSRLTNGFSQDRSPAWSPDGKHILFSSNPSDIHSENPNYDIYVMDANGSNITRLTDGPDVDHTPNPPVDLDPVWSPDGSRIVFYSTRLNEKFEKEASIHVMDADGSNELRLTETSASVQNVSPAWSPDGRYIAFASNRDHLDRPNVFDIYVMKADGSNVVRLTSSGNNSCPAWQP
jgi:TolB protein